MPDLIDHLHFTKLAALDPTEVCARTGASHDQNTNAYTLPFWTGACQISVDERRASWAVGTPQLPDYLTLVAVHCLLSAQTIRPSGRWVSEKDLPGGATFFRGPHAIPTTLITSMAHDSIPTFTSRCLTLGGTTLAMADAACAFTITEQLPVAVLYWAGDEEFPAEARLLFDETIIDHFHLDIVYALAVGVAETIGGLDIR